jgi:hypothetical protein
MTEPKSDPQLDAFVRRFGASHALFVEGDQDTDDSWEVFAEGREESVCGLNILRASVYGGAKDYFSAWALERGEELVMIHGRADHADRASALAEALILATAEGWVHPPTLDA